MDYPYVISIQEKSIAHNAGINVGDAFVSINGEPIRDVLDYQFFSHDPYLTIEIMNKDGEKHTIFLENEDCEDIGVELCYGKEGQTRHCKNKCIFCFVDQMPKGMRESLYVKDDDVRLSFLTGSYITLTNLTELDINRILFQKISPVNVSVHTVEPSLRVKMLKNKEAGKVYKLMKKLARGGIYMNCQVVLCKGINDDKHLSYTIKKLLKLYPYVNSLSVVPVGLTKYRENLPYLESFSKEDSKKVIEQIEKHQKKAYKKYGVNFVYASDEFYLKGEVPFPSAQSYDGYPQIENGVGMITSFREEVKEALGNINEENINFEEAGIITGFAAKDVIEETVRIISDKYKNVNLKVYPIKNDFFGHDVTVSGLVCGKDIISQLSGKELPKRILMPDVMFRKDTDIMLDDVTICELEEKLSVKIAKIKTDGFSTVEAILGI